MLQSMQHTIKSNFEEVKGKLVELDSRITSMEGKQLQLEKDYRRPGTLSSSDESPSDRTRKRRTPLNSRLVSSLSMCCHSFINHFFVSSARSTR